MKLTCLDECRVLHKGLVYSFEETSLSGCVYEVDETLGNKAVATKKCVAIVEDEEHPYSGPTPVAPSIRP